MKKAKGLLSNEKFNYNFITLIMLLFPIIDAINSIISRNFTISFSIGMLAKAIFILYLFTYFVFQVENSKSKKVFFYYTGALAIWFVLFLGNRIGLLNISNIFNECVYIFKYYYSVIILVLLYYFCKGNKFDNEKIKKLMLLSFFVYTALLFIPYITGTAYNSYKIGLNAGKVGWFFTANEVGAIMLALLYFAIDKALTSKKLFFIIILLGIFSTLEIGTKITLLGVFLLLGYFAIKNLIKFNKNNILYLLVIIIFAIIVTFTGALKTNVALLLTRFDIDINNISLKIPFFNEQETKEDQPISKEENKTEDNNGIISLPENTETNKNEANNDSQNNSNNDASNNQNTKDNTQSENNSNRLPDGLEEKEQIPNLPGYNSTLDTLVSGRETLLKTTLDIYKNSSPLDKIVGLGFTNTKEINNPNIEKLIEMDFFDIFFYFGIGGFLLFVIPYIFFAILILEKIIKYKKFNWETIGYIFMIGLLFGIALLVGHVLSAPAVSIFLAFLILLLHNEVNDISNNETKENNKTQNQKRKSRKVKKEL